MGYSLVITNSGTADTITFGSGGIYLEKMSYNTAPANNAFWKSPYQDGSSFIGSLYDELEITLQGTIVAGTEAALYAARRTFQKILYKGNAPFILTQNSRAIKAYPASVDFPKHEGPLQQLFLVSMIAPNPFWYNPTVNDEEVTEGTPKVCANAGDVETPVTIVIDGPCKDPIITNTTTGEAINVIGSVGSGETLTITTGFGEKTIVHDTGAVETNWMPNLDSTNKDFIWLAKGNNSITIADDSVNTVVATIYWYDRFLGV